MKNLIIVFLIVCVALTGSAQQEVVIRLKTLFPDDPKGLRLPPGEPRMVDTNGNVVWIDENFTSPQYQTAAVELVIKEANKVAKELKLPEELPITETNIVQEFIGPFGYNYLRGAIGNLSTSKYIYCVPGGNKFCYLEDTHQAEELQRYEKQYLWPISRMDTNQAYQLATQWLNAVSMNVKGLNRDCSLFVEPYRIFPFPKGKFVPVYFVTWVRRDLQYGGTAEVLVFPPEKKLLSLRVEDPRYILRKPLIFTNLDDLLPGPTQIFTNHTFFHVTPNHG